MPVYSANAGMTLNPGAILKKRYRIVKLLGQGGFGAVYRAEDLSLKNTCALKENLDYVEAAQRQFEREALILAALRHPGMPRVTDFFLLPDQGQYLVMDFIDGYDLQEILERTNQPLFEKQALEWIGQVCDALTYMHNQNSPIIHRDIKPANIKITSTGKAMLVDFGVAKIYRDDTLTTTGARAVTLGFSPIEQYGQGTTDARSDQYSLAATLYYLLTNQRPPESVARATGTELIPPRQINPAVSYYVERAILRGMEMLTKNRYPSVADFRLALQQARQATSPASQRLPPLPPGLANDVGGKAPAPLSRPITIRPAEKSANSDVQIEWVDIPAGEFKFGEERRPCRLPAFQISRHPVSNQQYRSFLAANPGQRAPEYWKGREFPRSKARHPVVGVSLLDALAFCMWLGARLPTDEEWEKAARGIDGRSYPWGEEWADGLYCNNLDARIGGTTPVDKYPRGCSPYGVWDMAGNTWEWTASEHQGPHMHILCGGSWRVFSRFAVRVFQRDRCLLEDMRDDLGFRCARTIDA
jgi:eukaryotic-like serine/threonine-protein kinase